MFNKTLKAGMLFSLMSALVIIWIVTGGESRFDRMKQINHDRSVILNNSSILSFHTGKYAQGIEELDEALSLDPNNKTALYNASIFYIIHRPAIARVKYGAETPENIQLALSDAVWYNKRILEVDESDEDTLSHYAENMTFIYMIRKQDGINDIETITSAKNAWFRLYTKYPKRVYYTFLQTCTDIINELGYDE